MDGYFLDKQDKLCSKNRAIKSKSILMSILQVFKQSWRSLLCFTVFILLQVVLITTLEVLIVET
ncbi:MAG: hypothetical protein EBR30_12895 [Cytophagia bacterium]|nr:hypothetical protein [Cytophagia bacterium]NBW35893.1 hypothetical protein [Cytophagia bacterium]